MQSGEKPLVNNSVRYSREMPDHMTVFHCFSPDRWDFSVIIKRMFKLQSLQRKFLHPYFVVVCFCHKADVLSC